MAKKKTKKVASKKLKPFKWVVEFTIDPVWVADGFDPDSFAFKEAIWTHLLGYANDCEIEAKILKKPAADAIAKEQGYKSN